MNISPANGDMIQKACFKQILNKLTQIKIVDKNAFWAKSMLLGEKKKLSPLTGKSAQQQKWEVLR